VDTSLPLQESPTLPRGRTTWKLRTVTEKEFVHFENSFGWSERREDWE
jgi:hypothetical protein